MGIFPSRVQTHILLPIMWQFLDIHMSSPPIWETDIKANIRCDASRLRDQERDVPMVWRQVEWWSLTYVDLSFGLFADLLLSVCIEDPEDRVPGRSGPGACGLLMFMVGS